MTESGEREPGFLRWLGGRREKRSQSGALFVNSEGRMSEQDQLEARLQGREYLFVWGRQSWSFRTKGFRELNSEQAESVLEVLEERNWSVHQRLMSGLSKPYLTGTSGVRGGMVGAAEDLRVFVRNSESWVILPKAKEKKTSEKQTLASLSEIKVRVVRQDTKAPMSGQKFQITLSNEQVTQGETDAEGWCEFRGIPAGLCEFRLLAQGWEGSS